MSLPRPLTSRCAPSQYFAGVAVLLVVLVAVLLELTVRATPAAAPSAQTLRVRAA